MRKIVVSEFVTLDDVMQGPGNNEPGFDRGGWNLPYMDEEAVQNKGDELVAADGLLLGRVTYQAFAAAWPNIDAGIISEKMNGLPKYVVGDSLTDSDLSWNNTTHLQGDVLAEIANLKQASGKDILIYGSGVLVQSLMQADLIDEYRLMVHPIVLGMGKRLFKDGLDLKKLKTIDAKVFPRGITLLTYTRI